MAAVSRIELGLSSQDFWEMTPRQLQLLFRKHLDRLKRMGYNVPVSGGGMGPDTFDAFSRAVGA